MKKKSSINRKTLSLFWRFTRPNPFLFWYGTLGAVAGVMVADILPPLIVAQGFNRIQAMLAANQTVTIDALMPYFLMFSSCVIASLVIWRTEAWCVWQYGINAQQRMADHLFDHVQHMGSKFHADRFGGALVSQLNKFITSYDRITADFTWSILTGITALIASLIVLFVVSPIYAGIFSVVVIAYFFILYRLMKKQAPYNRRLATSESDRTAKIADNITNIATVRAFAGEQQERELFHKQTTATANATRSLLSVQMKNELFSHFGTSVIDILAFGTGLFAITKFNAPVGTLFLVVSYSMALTNRMWQSMFIMRNMNRSFGDAADMTEILEMEPEIKDPKKPEEPRMNRGSIGFKNVTFRYRDSKRGKLFDDLSFQIKPGEKIGLVGHSGGGKTTITRLLLRFMDIQEGQIEIDGQDITSVRQSDLRASIAYVPQEPLLFHRTLADNIAYGKPGATKKEIVGAAKMAHAHEFIEQLSEGYDTLVGERGVKLSGGQRQRIAIARAMLKNAPILVLDEATSALDSESEQLIQDALWKLMEGRTAIVIAHRLSTIQKMDRILVMEKGRIAEQGTHRELLRKDGIYASLWTHQTGGFLEE